MGKPLADALETRDEQGLSVYLCARVATYRDLARGLTGPQDVVVELGASEGHTTCTLARRAQRVIAVEKSAASLEIARRRCPCQSNITWLELDAAEVGEVSKLVEQVDLIFLDVGGSAKPTLALKLAGMYRQMFRPRAMVIRNVGLNDFAAALVSVESEAPAGHWRNPHAPSRGEQDS